MKRGYKQTQVGMIPENWKVRKLKECCSRITVGFVGTCEPFYTRESDGVLLLRTGNLQDDGIELTDVKYVTRGFHATNRKSQVNQGDILIARHGDFGSAVLVPSWINDVNALNIVIIRTDDKLLLGSFAAYSINSDAVKRQAQGKAAGSTQVVINTGEIADLVLSVPVVPEQRAIAEVLSDADTLIKSLGQLIAKKRQIKKGAMQELLTGKRRLPGFRCNWKVRVLSDLGRFTKGKGIRKDAVVGDGVPCIRYGEIYTRHNDFVREFYSFIPQSITQQSQRLRTGDLLFAGSGETAEEIGKCVAILGEEEAYAGGDIVIFTPSGQDSMYLGYLMNHVSISVQKAKMGQGDAVVHISARNLGQLQLCVPPLQEQTAIATILSDMDTEITALERKLTKARMIKQGMMQELLTGKVRLI